MFGFNHAGAFADTRQVDANPLITTKVDAAF